MNWSTSHFLSILFRLGILKVLLVASTSFASLPDSLQPKFDSFIRVLESKLDNQTVVDSVWSDRPWDCMDLEQSEFDRMVNLLNTRIDQAESLEEEAIIHHLLQDIYQKRQLLGKAVVQYEKMTAIHTVLQDTMQVIRDYHWMAWMYHNNKLYEESLIAYEQVMRIQRHLEMDPELASNVWTLGYFYSVAGWELKKPNYQDSAVKYLEKSFEYCMDMYGEVHLEWIITYAMGLARQGNKRKAIEIAVYGLTVAEKHNEILYKGRFNKQLSQYYMALDMADSAFYHIYKAAYSDDEMYPKDDPNVIELGRGRGRLHMFNLGFLLEVQNRFGRTDESTAILDRILEGPGQLTDYDALMYYRQLGAKSYYLHGDFEKSAHNYSLYVAYSDSLHRAELDKAREVKTAQMESQIALERERAGKEKAQQEELAKQEKENLRTIIYAAISFALIIIAFLIVVYRRFKVTAKQKKLIEKQKVMVESAYAQLDSKNKEIIDSIGYAKRIQYAILPNKASFQQHLPNSFVVYIPKDIVAGDFYWLEKKGDKVLFAAADCTGHGVPGAMVSVICNNGLNRSVREHGITDPGKILDKTREIVMQEFEKSDQDVNDGMDIALCSISTTMNEDGSRTLQYAGAHNPLWIIRKGTDLAEEYKADKQPIGKFFHQQPYTTQTTTVQSGDMLYIFSDGFSDQFGGERGKKYYVANFQKFLLSIYHLPLDEQKTMIISEFNRWKGEYEQIDDICVMGVHVG